MSITVECACGKRLKARNEDAGKKAKCPGCGAVVVIEEALVLEEVAPSAPIGYQAITLDIGHVQSGGCYVSMNLKIEENGDGSVMMFVSDTKSRRSGEMVRFRPSEFSQYLALIEKVRACIRDLQSSGRMSRMIEG